jgi:hypothetical protein
MSDTKDLYQYVSADYYATGEGRTLSLLITRAYHRTEDWIKPPEYVKVDNEWKLIPGQEKFGAGLRAVREFAEVFDGFIAQGAELHTHEEFMNKYGHYVPAIVQDMISSDDGPGNLHWHQQFHYNFS